MNSRKKLSTSGEVAKKFDLPRWKFAYLVEKGALPGPSLEVPGRRLFTEEDMEAIAAALEASPELRETATTTRND